MNSRGYALVALGMAMVAACGDDDGDGNGGGSGTSLQALCQRGCMMEASLACPNDTPATCLSECEQEAAQVPEACRAQATAAVECAVNRPASDWECDEDEEAAPKDGVCAQQVGAAVACVFESNQEDGTCAFENDDECDDPTGTDLCPAGTDVADCTGG